MGGGGVDPSPSPMSPSEILSFRLVNVSDSPIPFIPLSSEDDFD